MHPKKNATPTLYLLEDVTLPDTSIQQISFSVNIIGKKDNVENAKVTVKGSGGSGTAVAKFGNSGTFTVKNVIVDGESMRRGIDNAGVLTLENCMIKDCKAVNGDGGGIYASSGTVSISKSSITNCSANSGGGVYIDNGCKLTMTDSTISSCTASRGGGISINCSSRTMSYPVSFTNCEIISCTGTSDQASICASTSTGYVGSNEDLTSANVWNTAISGMVFTNWNQAVTYNE